MRKKQLFYETMEQCEHVTSVDYQQTTMLASGGMQRQVQEHPHLEDAQFRRGGDKKNRPQGGATCWLISIVDLKPGVIERLASGPASGGLSRIR